MTLIRKVHTDTEYPEDDFPTVAKISLTPEVINLIETMHAVLTNGVQRDNRIYKLSAAHWEIEMISSVAVDDYDAYGQLLPDRTEQPAWATDGVSLDVHMDRFRWIGFLKHCEVAFYVDFIYLRDIPALKHLVPPEDS